MSSTTFIGRRVIVRDALTQPGTGSGSGATPGAHASAWCQCGSPSCSAGRTGGAWLRDPAAPVAGAQASRLRGPARGAGPGRGPGSGRGPGR
jgi:hypothetical protein